MSIPSPKPSSSSTHSRRPSLPISPSLSPRVSPLPVPQRHGSINARKRSVDVGSYGSHLSASLPASIYYEPCPQDTKWLDVTADELCATDEACFIVSGDTGTEDAVEQLLSSGATCLLVDKASSYGFFDYTDLNAFLLLVLQAAGTSALDPKSHDIASRLRRGQKIPIGDLCNLSHKSPYHACSPDATLRDLLPIFASGVHRIAMPPRIITHTMLLRYLVTHHAAQFTSPVSASTLSPAISLPHTASVLDAMHVMNIRQLGALGVVRRHASSNSSSGSSVTSSPDPFEVLLGSNDMLSVVTCRDCTRLVVPSEGKQVLGMSLDEMVKKLQVAETAGQARGEERFPVHTITSDTTLLHASHLILATASARVFVRTVSAPTSPPVSPLNSPAPSLEVLHEETLPGLPAPPPTHLSTNQVLSIVDILAALARNANLKPHTTESIRESGRRRRFSTLEPKENLGFESWRWTQ